MPDGDLTAGHVAAAGKQSRAPAAVPWAMAGRDGRARAGMRTRARRRSGSGRRFSPTVMPPDVEAIPPPGLGPRSAPIQTGIYAQIVLVILM